MRNDTSTTRTQPLHGYLPTLDGWRAIAIGIVILTHDKIYTLGPLSTGWIHAGGGPGGVELFFAISGLLICSRLLGEESRSGTISLRNFYIKRCFRIWPVAWLYLGVLLVLMAGGILQHSYHGILYSFLMVRNYLPLSFVPPDWYTTHFWSLSVEEHFYLFLPAFLLLVHRFRVRILLGIVLMLTAWIRYTGAHPELLFGWKPIFHTDIAVRGILLSAALAIVIGRPGAWTWCTRWLNPYAALLTAAAIFLLQELHGGYVTSFAALFTYPLLILSTLTHPASLPGRILEWPAVRWIGRISYSIYLWQMLFFPFYMPIPTPQSKLLAELTNTWLRFPTVLVLSMASYYLLEKPMIRIGHRLTHSRIQPREAMPQAVATS